MAFLPFIAGLTKGGVDTFTQLSEEERKQKTQRNKLMADTLMKEIESNEQLTPEEQTHLHSQAMKLYGFDKKTADSLTQATAYFRQALSEKQRVAKGPEPAQEMAPFPLPQAEAMGLPTTTMPGPSLAGPMPTMKTAGQLKFEEKQPREMQAEREKQTAIREAQRVQRTGEIEDKIAIRDKYDNTPYADDVRRMLGMAPKTSGAFTLSPAMRGQELINYYTQAGRTPPADIDPNRLYKAALDQEKKPTGHFGQEETAVSGRPAIGASFAGMFTHDMAKNPVNPASMYVPLHAKEGGAIIGLIPETEVGTTATTTQWLLVPQIDGSTKVIGMPKETVTEKTAGGVPITPAATPATPPPSMPVGIATPGQPRPAPPKPIRGGTVVGGKPLGTDEYRGLNAAQEGLNKMNELLKMVKEDPNIIMKAAVPGVRGVLAPTWSRYTGELADIVTRVRTGAALNQEEERFYGNQLPGAADVLAQSWNFDKNAVENAIQLHRDYFQRVVNQYGPRAVERGAYTIEGTAPAKTETKSTKKATPKTPVPGKLSKEDIAKRLRGEQ